MRKEIRYITGPNGPSGYFLSDGLEMIEVSNQLGRMGKSSSNGQGFGVEK